VSVSLPKKVAAPDTTRSASLYVMSGMTRHLKNSLVSAKLFLFSSRRISGSRVFYEQKGGENT
jgi:hypothetical protein